MKHIEERLAYALKQRVITLANLAEKSGIEKNRLWAVSIYPRIATEAEVIALASALNVSIDHLVLDEVPFAPLQGDQIAI